MNKAIIKKIRQAQTGIQLPSLDSLIPNNNKFTGTVNGLLNNQTSKFTNTNLNINNNTNTTSSNTNGDKQSDSQVDPQTNTQVDNSKDKNNKESYNQPTSLSSYIPYINNGVDLLSSVIPQNTAYNGTNGALTQGIDNAYGLVSNNIMKINPIAGVIMKGAGLANQALSSVGIGTDGMTKTDAILSSNFGALTPIGLANSLGAKKSHNFFINNNTIEQVGGDYGGTTDNIYSAQNKANKKYGLFSNSARQKANRFIDRTQQQQGIMTGIANEALDQQAQKSDLAYLGYNLAQNGGYQQNLVRAAKLGTKLSIKKKFKPNIVIEDINKYQKGGNITIQVAIVKEPSKKLEKTEESEDKNVIPDGALHAHKHHIENSKALTQKGIPVINDEGEQEAEIEKDEIILTLKLTNKLEELYSQYEKASKSEQDKIAIEAGKILVEEILHNTVDNTGLIDKCKEGGKINEHK